MTSKFNIDNYVYILSDYVYTTNISEGCVIRNYAGIVQRLIMVDDMQEYMHTKAPYGHSPLVNLTIFVYGSTDLLV